MEADEEMDPKQQLLVSSPSLAIHLNWMSLIGN